ncbi:MAG: DUF493 domain-containing protein [Gammaproteobacteria bacterium]|nr:DUF493 domain-containing protein [Gammaproteobacteria bacterium]
MATPSVDPSADSLLEFPCDFPIKVVGKAGCDLDAIVFTLTRAHAPDLGEGAVSSRLSRNGNYQSVTVQIRATSRAQLDDIYRALSAHDDILMVL